ncbi:type II toxin-antitoxin system HicA family toxin [Candidatus Sumerlaeota bacterium]|nr:type II toxin-antitoxin system HicA family toxin [Candidatus Sumerlaeota bacterium]
MSVESSRLRSVTVRHIISVLGADGFAPRSQSGSPRQFKDPDGRRVTVSGPHSGDTFPLNSPKRMVEDQAKWTEDDLPRLRLL